MTPAPRRHAVPPPTPQPHGGLRDPGWLCGDSDHALGELCRADGTDLGRVPHGRVLVMGVSRRCPLCTARPGPRPAPAGLCPRGREVPAGGGRGDVPPRCPPAAPRRAARLCRCRSATPCLPGKVPLGFGCTLQQLRDRGINCLYCVHLQGHLKARAREAAAPSGPCHPPKGRVPSRDWPPDPEPLALSILPASGPWGAPAGDGCDVSWVLAPSRKHALCWRLKENQAERIALPPPAASSCLPAAACIRAALPLSRAQPRFQSSKC